MMRNVTVTLDDETARWARIEAAKREMSLSSFIRETLRERMVGELAYDASMERHLARPAVPLKRGAPRSGHGDHARAGAARRSVIGPTRYAVSATRRRSP